MAEAADRIGEVLADPVQMERIAQMAARLMGSIAPEGTQSGAAPSEGDASLAGLVGRVMSSLQGDGNKKQLLQGLSPYLSARRRERLSRALRLASAAALAGAAFSELGGEEP